MPAYNAGAFIVEAVESVLSQSFSDFELIVVEDKSTDDTAVRLRGFSDRRLRILSQARNLGQAAALNRALEAASGEFVAIQDADDASHPSRFADQVELLERSPELMIVGSSFELIDETGVTIGLKRRPLTDTGIRWWLLFNNPFAHSSVMFRRSVLLDRELRYDAAYGPAIDYALWSQILRYGRGANLDRALVRYRIHAQQMLGDRHVVGVDRVSVDNFRGLGLNVDMDLLRSLRQFWVHPPQRLVDGEGAAAAMLAAAAIRFGAAPLVDRAEARRIRSSTLRKVVTCAALSADDPRGWREIARLVRTWPGGFAYHRKRAGTQ